MAQVLLPPGGVHEQFAERGYLDPVRILTPRQCQHFMKAATQPHTPPPLDWHKGHAASARPFYEVATHPRILDIVTRLLGHDVMLWGAQLVTRGPGAVHPWHSDIEPSAAAEGKTVTVWLGIEHTTADSALTVVPYSHRFGATLQEVVSQRRAAGQDATATTDRVASWALERERRAALVMPPVTDGVALFFEGHLWHHSNNLSSRTRRALLLQYATPDVPIRIPDLNYVGYPFRHMNVPRPGCLMVSGSDKAGVNRMVSAPVSVSPGLPARLGSRVYPVDVPLQPKGEKKWTPYPIFKGATAGVRAWSCHASVLLPNHSPHPPHRHDEEELLMVLDGEADLELPECGWAAEDQRLRLKPGQFVFYPPNFPHTLRATNEKPASYLMFKWYDGATASDSPLPFGRYDTSAPGADGAARHDWGARQKFFAAPTANLGTLKCHVSTMAPGAGYAPHTDAYDVAIVTLEGEVETLGERVPPRSVIFYPAGELHGMRNVGGTQARYVVFEFHSGRIAPDLARYARPSLLRRLTDPHRWRRQIKQMLSR
jgi:quercetin dioxygenase-like cupin family protein